MKRYGDIKYSLRRYERMEGNFTQVSNDVFKLTNGNEYKIYSYLCSNYNRELGYSFINLNDISENINVSIPTIIKSIKNLNEIGLVETVKLQNKVMYKIFVPDIKNKIIENENTFIPILEEQHDDLDENKIYTFKYEYKGKNNKNKRKNNDYIKWRNGVLQRDDYTCKMCGKTDDECILNVHHIIKYSDDESLRTDINNGITLCYECHKKIFNKEKEFEEYFKNLIND